MKKAGPCSPTNPTADPNRPNEALSTTAFKSLEFLLCIDIYHNESTKHADVLLPGTSPFEDGHYDQFLGSMGYRNVARYSPPIFEPTQPSEWRMGLHLAYMTVHQAVATEDQIKAFEDDLVAGYATAYVSDEQSPLFGRDIQQLMAAIEPTEGVERILDLGIRAGRWGDHFSSDNGLSSSGDKLTLATIQANPNGIDLGLPSKQRLKEVIRHADGKIDFAPPAVIVDFERLRASIASEGTFQLIGRRRPQSNNSWLRNIPMLTKTKNHCVLEMNEADAKRLDISDGQEVILSANQQSLKVAVDTSADIAPGVVSLPHGFSEDAELNQSNSQKGPNYNRLVPANRVDALSATSALNGAPVALQKAT
jgi:anaerobic selenocysteine-containing dehydrogenase